MRVGASSLSLSSQSVKAIESDVDRPAFSTSQQTNFANPNFARFCRLFLEQITTALSGLCTWLKYYSPDNQHPQFFSNHSSDWAGFDPSLLMYLEAEGWWTGTLPTFEIQALPIRSDRKVYICPLSHANRAEYLLIGSIKPLTDNQKRWLTTQVELLHEHFCLFQSWQQQQAKIQQWQQTLQQTQHQIRNPLALIEIYAATLVGQLPNGEPRSQASHIQDAAKELSAHLHKLGKNQPASTLNLNLHDLHQILADSLKGLQPWLTEKQITVQQPSMPALLRVDAWQLKQVFDNLLTNAVHFSPVGATITCGWEIFHHEILVEVWDEGSGLSETDLRKVFTPFYSRRPGGTGLGLAIAQKIVQEHHGRLWASNLPGKGAKFSFTLPRHPAATTPCRFA